MEGHEDIVTIEEIAVMAHSDPSAAAAWTREPGFPAPLAETNQGPVFSRGEVERWLREAGKKGEPPTPM